MSLQIPYHGYIRLYETKLLALYHSLRDVIVEGRLPYGARLPSTRGKYERHLRRMKRTYSRKFHLLAQLLHEHLSAWFDWVDSDAGLHLFGWWRHSAAAYTAYRELCASLGVHWAEAETGAEAIAAAATWRS